MRNLLDNPLLLLVLLLLVLALVVAVVVFAVKKALGAGRRPGPGGAPPPVRGQGERG